LSYPVAGGVVTPIHTVPRPVTIHKTTCDCVTTLLNCQWPCNCGKNLPWPRLYCRTRRNMVSHTHSTPTSTRIRSHSPCHRYWSGHPLNW